MSKFCVVDYIVQGHFFSLFSNLLVKTQIFFAHLVFLAFSDHIELFFAKKLADVETRCMFFALAKSHFFANFSVSI